MAISKSKFLEFKSCAKSLWLHLNHPELYEEDPDVQKHIDDGKEVGKYAKKAFPNVFDVTSYKKNGELDIAKMIELTNIYSLEGKETIAEASISFKNLFCSVDLLHLCGNEYEIYEVKATKYT